MTTHGPGETWKVSMEPKAAFWFNEACGYTRSAVRYAAREPQERPPAGYGSWREAAMNAAMTCLGQSEADRKRVSVPIPG